MNLLLFSMRQHTGSEHKGLNNGIRFEYKVVINKRYFDRGAVGGGRGGEEEDMPEFGSRLNGECMH